MPRRKKRRTAQSKTKNEVSSAAAIADAKWTFGDSVTVFGALVGVLAWLFVPPLYAKIPAFICVCAASTRFVWKSHWTHEWHVGIKVGITGVAIAVMSCMAIPQFLEQRKTDLKPSANMPEQVNSVVENSGKADHISISDATVAAPKNGRATVLRNLPGGEATNIGIQNPAVSDEGNPRSGALLHVPKGGAINRWFMEENSYCDGESVLKNEGTTSNLIAQQNHALNCDWVSFLGWVIGDHKDVQQRLGKWQTKLENQWIIDGLTNDQTERNRHEFYRVKAKVMEFTAASDPAKGQSLLDYLEQNPPQFQPSHSNPKG